MNVRRYAKWLIGPFVLFLVLSWYFKEPVNHALWDESVQVLTKIEISPDGNEIKFNGLRDWSYAHYRIVDKDYVSQNYNLEDLQRVWYYLQPLDKTGLVSHSFVV